MAAMPFWAFCIMYAAKFSAAVGLVFLAKYLFLKKDI
jgi:hypothetical protein